MKHTRLTAKRFARSLFLSGLLVVQGVSATCKTTITESTPNSRFTTNSDTVLDNLTGLVWMRCSLGHSWDGTDCSGTLTAMNWISALNVAESTNFAGFSDWRLPNVKELSSIVEDACRSPAINETVFPSTSAAYWSSSPYFSSNILDAMTVNFNNGFIGVTGQDAYVRLVRSEQ